MQKMLIQMQKSQQWSFEHLQKQIDEMPERIAASRPVQMYTDDLGDKSALTQAK
jgi:hypothetical protein